MIAKKPTKPRKSPPQSATALTGGVDGLAPRPDLGPPDLTPFPWQRALWGQLQSSRAQGRAHHAVLLEGPAGMGLRHLARAYAARILCAVAGEVACGQCPSCRTLAAGEHVDVAYVVPEEEGKMIRIDSIRALADFCGLTAHGGLGRVILLEPAEAMNRAAANSLLKVLEEPPADTYFILVCHRPELLPATIRSRCQRLSLPRAAPDLSLPWLRARLPAEADPALCLALAGAPLAALCFYEEGRLQVTESVLLDLAALAAGKGEPLQIADRWLEQGMERTFEALFFLLEEGLRLAATGEAERLGAAPPTWHRQLQRIVDRVDLRYLFVFYDKLLELRRILALRVALREQELLEGLTISFAAHAINAAK